MKRLFDQNLSQKLVTRLADIFPNSSHVQFLDLAEKTDTDIWELSLFFWKNLFPASPLP